MRDSSGGELRLGPLAVLSSITNDLRDDQILTVRNDLSFYRRCTFDGSTDNGLSCDSLTCDSLTHNGPDPQWLDL